jgi:hypothetical protein
VNLKPGINGSNAQVTLSMGVSQKSLGGSWLLVNIFFRTSPDELASGSEDRLLEPAASEPKQVLKAVLKSSV